MRKIKLEVEDLRIESFATDGPVSASGTVYGRDFTTPRECPTVQSGDAACPGCHNSGNSSCVWCLDPNSGTCDDGCSWTNGDGAVCMN